MLSHGILFYTMNGCGFCNKAKKDLDQEIKNGQVLLVDSKHAPEGVRGFPHFISSTGLQHSGYAPKKKLFEALGISDKENDDVRENYENKPTQKNLFSNYKSYPDCW